MKKTTNYQQLAQAILKNIGGKENINNLIHCITRLRFYLKDESLANDEAIKQLSGVINVQKPVVNIKLSLDKP